MFNNTEGVLKKVEFKGLHTNHFIGSSALFTGAIEHDLKKLIEFAESGNSSEDIFLNEGSKLRKGEIDQAGLVVLIDVVFSRSHSCISIHCELTYDKDKDIWGIEVIGYEATSSPLPETGDSVQDTRPAVSAGV